MCWRTLAPSDNVSKLWSTLVFVCPYRASPLTHQLHGGFDAGVVEAMELESDLLSERLGH